MFFGARSSAFALQLIVASFLLSPLYGQTPVQLRVRVSDSSGLPIVGARVIGSETDANSNCTTARNGMCDIVRSGVSEVEVTANGFTPQRVPVTDGLVEARVIMHITSTQGVNVTSTSLGPASAQGSVLSGEEVDRVPVWLRRTESLQPLFAGAVPRSTDDEWGEGLSAAGARSTAMNSTLDGMPNRAERRGGFAIKPPLEAVSEFKVFTSGYSAEYGSTPGAQVAMTTRSGSETLHGDFYNYARDRFGGVLGGPIKKGKTYYFAGFERASTSFDSPVTSKVLNPDQLHSAASPLAKKLLALIPVSPTGYETYSGEGSLESQMLVRLDHVLSNMSRLTIRAARGSGQQVLEPDTGNVLPRYWPSLDDFANSILVSYSRGKDQRAFTLRASFLDELGRSISRCHYDSQYSISFGKSAAPPGCPIIEIAGYQSFGDTPFLYTSRSQTATFGVNASAVLGRDDAKLGLDVTRSRYTAANPSQENGYLYFDGSHTGSPVTDFLLGLASIALRDFAKSAQHGELKQTRPGVFLQNALKLRDSFMLDAGVRVDYLPSMTGRSKDLTNFDPVSGLVQNGYDEQLLGSQGIVVDPRIGFSWQPFHSTTVVRGGIGQYSGQDILSVVLGQLTEAAVPRSFVSTASGSAPFNPLAPAWTPIDISTLRGIDSRNRVSRMYQYSLTVERSLGSQLELEVSYIGSRGMHLGRLFNINMPLPTGALDSAGKPILARRYPAYGDIIYDDQDAASSYNSARILLKGRAVRGVDLNVSYTFSKSIDNASSTQNTNWTGLPYAQDPRHLQAERAVSDFDHRHQVSGYITVLLDKYSESVLLRRAQLSAVVNMMSGLPFSMVSDSSYRYRPDVVSDPYQNIPTGYLINPAAFKVQVPTAADPTYFGDDPRNSLRTPSFNTIDLAFNKGFKIKSRTELGFRIESFNLLNKRVPYINNVMDSAGFGKRRHFINQERHIVAGARLSF